MNAWSSTPTRRAVRATSTVSRYSETLRSEAKKSLARVSSRRARCIFVFPVKPTTALRDVTPVLYDGIPRVRAHSQRGRDARTPGVPSPAREMPFERSIAFLAIDSRSNSAATSSLSLA